MKPSKVILSSSWSMWNIKWIKCSVVQSCHTFGLFWSVTFGNPISLRPQHTIFYSAIFRSPKYFKNNPYVPTKKSLPTLNHFFRFFGHTKVHTLFGRWWIAGRCGLRTRRNLPAAELAQRWTPGATEHAQLGSEQLGTMGNSSVLGWLSDFLEGKYFKDQKVLETSWFRMV